MSKTWNYVPGDWWAYCDVCNKKLKASRIKKRWDGLLVCPEDFENRHSHDFIKVKQDKITVPFTSSEEAISYRYTTPWDYDDPPFLETIGVLDSFARTAAYKRTYNDAADIVVTSDVSVNKPTKNASDSVTTADVLTSVLTFLRTFTDTSTPASTGYLWMDDYIDRTYFAEAYVSDAARAIT